MSGRCPAAIQASARTPPQKASGAEADGEAPGAPAHEYPPVDPGEVDAALAAVDERVTRAYDVVAIDAQVEGAAVARSREHARVRQAGRGRDRARPRDAVSARRDCQRHAGEDDQARRELLDRHNGNDAFARVARRRRHRRRHLPPSREPSRGPILARPHGRPHHPIRMKTRGFAWTAGIHPEWTTTFASASARMRPVHHARRPAREGNWGSPA